jgi:hypothetical protein
MAIDIRDFMKRGTLGCLQVPAKDWREVGRDG